MSFKLPHLTLDPSFVFLFCRIDLEDHSLAVSAATGPSYYYRFGATFSQTFRLGENIDADGVAAKFVGGILTVQLPYKAPKPTGPRRIAIQTPPTLPPRPQHASKPNKPAETTAPAPAPAPQAAPAAERAERAEVDDMPELEPNSSDYEPVIAEATPAPPAPPKAKGKKSSSSSKKGKKATGKASTAPPNSSASSLSSEEKAAAWVAEQDHLGSTSHGNDDVEEDGSIEECEY